MSGGVSATTIAAVAASAVTVGSTIYNDVNSSGGSAGGTGSGSGRSGGLSVLQTQMANSVKFGQGPSIGGSKEPPISNPDMPLQPTKAQPEHAATGWNLRSTPTQAEGENQAKQDAGNVWAEHLSRYLGYNTRGLG